MAQTIPKPYDCKHQRRLFIRKQNIVSAERTDSHEVYVCPECGCFQVFGHVNGQPFRVEFEIKDPEAIAAAGMYWENVNRQMLASV
jgi:hypothetical protein